VKLLLDTHLLLWASERSARLSEAAKRLIDDPANELVFSVASIWEIAIKHSKGMPSFRVDPALLRNSVLQAGYSELDVSGTHAIAITSLAPIHKDPFDRLLISQSIVEGITLLTADLTIARYPGPIRKV
jgi:PIN domain nuclease of toxin-antitoxin system